MDAATTRERIAEALRTAPATPTDLAREFDVTPGEALTHARHLARSLEPTDEELLVAPPTCRDCGFDRFDDLLNRPSRCPECRGEGVEEPVLTVD